MNWVLCLLGLRRRGMYRKAFCFYSRTADNYNWYRQGYAICLKNKDASVVTISVFASDDDCLHSYEVANFYNRPLAKLTCRQILHKEWVHIEEITKGYYVNAH